MTSAGCQMQGSIALFTPCILHEFFALLSQNLFVGNHLERFEITQI